MLKLTIISFTASFYAFAEESVDLGSLGLNEFNPYLVERNYWLLLVPAVLILGVFLHLKKNPYRIKNPFYEETTNEKQSEEKASRDNILPFSRPE